MSSCQQPAKPIAPITVERGKQSILLRRRLLYITIIYSVFLLLLLVIGAPYRDRVTNPSEAELMIRYRAAIRSSMQQNQVPYLEILELTEAASPANEGFFGELIHPNHMGH